VLPAAFEEGALQTHEQSASAARASAHDLKEERALKADAEPPQANAPAPAAGAPLQAGGGGRVTNGASSLLSRIPKIDRLKLTFQEQPHDNLEAHRSA
jgi:hypothetical protein